MEVANTVQASELAPLRTLASEFLAADSVEIGVLDRIASLAAELAARCREQARQQVLDLVEARALPLLPGAADELRTRLAPMSVDELSALAALLDRAVTARAAFEEADSGLMAARRRGDYAAMAPLALEAGAEKSALETATAEFARRLGVEDVLPEDSVGTETVGDETAPFAMAANDEASALAASAEPEVAPPVEASVAEDMLPATATTTGSEPSQDVPGEAEPAEVQPERRRLRALIRQMRPASDEAPATR